MTAWKDLERRVARQLGGHRNGPNPGSDVVGTRWSVECKRTVRYGLRRSWIEQARRQGDLEQRPWLLVIAEHNDRRPIVVMDFADLLELIRDVEKPRRTGRIIHGDAA